MLLWLTTEVYGLSCFLKLTAVVAVVLVIDDVVAVAFAGAAAVAAVVVLAMLLCCWTAVGEMLALLQVSLLRHGYDSRSAYNQGLG